MTKEEIAKSKGLTITKNAPPSKKTKYFEKHSHINANQPGNYTENVKIYENTTQSPTLEEIKEKISIKYPKLEETKIFDIVKNDNSQQKQNKPQNPSDPPNNPPNTDPPSQQPTDPLDNGGGSQQPGGEPPQEQPSNPPSEGGNNGPQDPPPSEPPQPPTEPPSGPPLPPSVNLEEEEKKEKIWRKNDKAIKEKKYEDVEIFEASLKNELYTKHPPITKKYMDETFLDKKFDIWVDNIEGSNLVTKRYVLTFKSILYMSLFYRNEFDSFKLSPVYSKEEVTECYKLFGFALIYFDTINAKQYNLMNSNRNKRVLIMKFKRNHKDRITEVDKNLWPGVDLKKI